MNRQIRNLKSPSHGDHTRVTNMIRPLLVCLTVVTGVVGAPGLAQVHSANDAAARCEALGNTDFSRIQDAPTTINITRLVEAGGQLPAYCQVQGYVWPQVSFELRLPLSRWNGKFFEEGCGGSCGSTNYSAYCPLHRGYA